MTVILPRRASIQVIQVEEDGNDPYNLDRATAEQLKQISAPHALWLIS